jgi:hypothetical protein
MPDPAALLALLNTRIVVGAVVVAYCLLWLLAKRFLMRGGWKILPVVIGLPAILFTGNELRWEAFEGQLADAVRPMMGSARASFECERILQGAFASHGRGGHVSIGRDGKPIGAAFLSSNTCARVKAYRADSSGASREQIFAVHTVTHEAAHLAGMHNEAKAECTAIQRDVATMTNLGATRSDAIAQVKSYLTLNYPGLPDNYRSDQCKSGGAMDLTPKDGTWP